MYQSVVHCTGAGTGTERLRAGGHMLQPVARLASTERGHLTLCADEMQKPVVIKTTWLENNAVAERVRREVMLSAESLSEFIVRSRGWLVNCSPMHELHMLLDYLPGGDLAQLMDREGPLAPTAARFYAGCAALALEALHARSIVHRDLKPDNLCVGTDGYAKLCDLGFAREVGTGERAMSLLGTPEYLSPEAFLGHGVDTRADVWALGISLYTMLTMSQPWHGDNTQELYRRRMALPPILAEAPFPHAP